MKEKKRINTRDGRLSMYRDRKETMIEEEGIEKETKNKAKRKNKIKKGKIHRKDQNNKK
jgi:hypothetical protein